MDFKSLREQILVNIDEYNSQDMKVVITKLLDFLIDNSEKRSKLEEENKQLFEESKKNTPNEFKGKLDDILVKANNEAKRLVENAKKERESILEKANKNSKQIIEEAENKSQEMIQNSITKIESIISEIKKLDDEAKLYRAHILSIFKKTIFRFTDTNYHIIRSDNSDFRELLQFFEVDEKLQKLCDENIYKIQHNEAYRKIVKHVKENPEIDDLEQIPNILDEKQILIDDEKINFDEVIKKSELIEEEIKTANLEEEDIEEETSANKQTFMEIMNKYKKK